MRTQITETVTMETTETVHSAPPDSRPRGEDETTSYLPGRRPEEEEDIPVLKDPRYELPSGLPQEKEEEEEKKPVNAVK